MEQILRDLIRLGFTEEQANIAYKKHYEDDKLDNLEAYIMVRECLATIL